MIAALARRTPPSVAILGLAWIALALVVLLLAPNVLSTATLRSVLQFASLLALVSLGQALVILAGGAGIDLSVGGTASLAGVLTALAAAAGAPGVALAPLAVGIGAALGAANGLLVTRLRVFPLIVTLATLYVYAGLAVALTGGAAVPGAPDWATAWGRGLAFGLPLPFLTLVLPAYLVAGTLLGATAWGTWIYAMGRNETAARLVGVPVDRVRTALYAASGALAGAAGFVGYAWLGSARPNVGLNLELESLTAAMLGGFAIFGGRGGVGALMASVLLVVALKTVLLRLGVNPIWQLAAVGALLVVVLLAERLGSRRR
jgi:ribose/xylose/arabinose/galactoside ABC-type transport system permease subunit